MDYQPYLVFELSGSRYGILAAAVQELFFLPEITPIAEVPPYITGVLNLRGEILPVMDLHRRIGRPSPPYQLTDSVIVLQTQSCRVGIIVTQVLDVQSIAVDHITAGAVYGHGQATSSAQFVTGVTRVDDAIVTLLDPEQLIQAATLVFDHDGSIDGEPLGNYQLAGNRNHLSDYQTNGNGTTTRPPVQQPANALFAHLSPIERQVLRARADSVRQSLTTTDATEQVALAVMGLGDEYFGLGLETVYEFTDIPRVTPVPCCPPHIVGNMNLRGEIVTLVDIRSVINLPTSSSTFHKAIVVRSEQLVAGIAVDHIYDVMYVHPSQIAPAPVAMRSLGDEYLQGVASYRDKLMSIINLPKLLNSGTLVVCEEV